MNRNKIEIRIAGPHETLLLELTPQHYKQQFRQFVERYRLGEEQAFELKSAIQSMLIRLAKGEGEKEARGKEVGVGMEEEGGRLERERIEKSMQTEKEEEKMMQGIKQGEDVGSNYSTAVPAQLMRQEMEQQQQDEPLPTFRMIANPETSSATIKQKSENTALKTIKMRAQSDTIKKHTPQPQPMNKSIRLSPARSPIGRSPSDKIFDRLYHTPTASFKDKFKAEINQSDELYQSMNEHQLKHNLKRTTNAFFAQLSKNHTIAFTNKHLKPDKPEEVPIHKTPSPKATGKSGSPAKWESGCRCEMKEEIRKREKELSQQKVKMQEIRKRMQQQAKNKKQLSPPATSPPHISRDCRACTPKISPKKPQPLRKPKPQPPKQVRPYISNILQDSYLEFTQGLPSS